MNTLVSIVDTNQHRPKELAVINGKGGTAKTSLVASFAALAEHAVVADCDVDAADLHLLLEPRVAQSEKFTGGKLAVIEQDQCGACGNCVDLCRVGAIRRYAGKSKYVAGPAYVDPLACEGCGVCVRFCPEHAIHLEPVINGEWFISETRLAPMVHAKLGIAQQNSGKLVTIVRMNAQKIARERGLNMIITDGSPGIGCPVIASVTGVDMALVVTEPTISGLHDLERVADLTRQFGAFTMVCVNKWDLNPEMTKQIEARAQQRNLSLAGRIRYDDAVTEAQVQGQTVVEYQKDGCADDIRAIWAHVHEALTEGVPQMQQRKSQSGENSLSAATQ